MALRAALSERFGLPEHGVHWPDARHEAFRHLPWRRLERLGLEVPVALSAAPEPLPTGSLSEARPTIAPAAGWAPVPAPGEAFTELARCFGRRERLELADGERVALTSIGDQDLALAAGEVALPAGRAATLLWQHRDAARLRSRDDRIEVGAGASLQLLLAALGAPGTNAIGRLCIDLAEGASLDLHLLLAGGLRHQRLHVSLGPGSRLSLSGISLGDGQAHLEAGLVLDHRGPGGHSTTAWRSLADGASRVVLSGLIAVHAGATDCEAHLSSKALMCSPRAEVVQRPELSIDVDQVQCSHGASVGALDEAACFYLQSRGIDAAMARQMLAAAFCRERLEAISDPDLAAAAEALLCRTLPALPA